MVTPLKKLKDPSDLEIPGLLPPETREKMKYYRKVECFNGWNDLRYQAKNRSSLRSFELDCTFKNPNDLARSLKVQKTLTGLSLPVYNQLRNSMVKQLPTLKCLRKIELSPSPKMTEKDLEKFAIQLRGSLPQVHEFFLNFIRTGRFDRIQRTKEKGLKSLAFHLGKNFHKQKNLRLFSFNVEYDRFFTDEGVLFLVDQVSTNIKSLEHFILRVRGCQKINSSVFAEIARIIGTCNTLKKLTFENNYSDDQVLFDDDGNELEEYESLLIPLVEQIGKNLGGLTHLCLVLIDYRWFVEDGFRELATQIPKNLKSLEHLQLDFQNIFLIDDERIEILIDAIRENLPMLKVLTLDFSKNENITDKSIKSLSKLIRNDLKMIEEVNLYFDDCEKITPKGEKILKRLNRI